MKKIVKIAVSPITVFICLFISGCALTEMPEISNQESQNETSSDITKEYVLSKYIEAGFKIDSSSMGNNEYSLSPKEALILLAEIKAEEDSLAAISRASDGKTRVKLRRVKVGNDYRYEFKYRIFDGYLFPNDEPAPRPPFVMKLYINTSGIGDLELSQPTYHQSYDAPYYYCSVLIQAKRTITVAGVDVYNYKKYDIKFCVDMKKLDYVIISDESDMMDL